MTLRGPADADAFRTKRNNQRWYHDPLPTCEVADATDDLWPSASALKRAWSKEFTKKWEDGKTYPLDPLRVAEYVDQSFEKLAPLDRLERVPMMAGAAQRDLNKAAARGTAAHGIIEALIDGAIVLTDEPEYEAICRQLVTEMSPTIDYAECVVISRTLGVAGTGDCIATIAGQRYFIDWKTRAATSSHAAYPEEVAQIGCYVSGDYLIAEVDGAAKRLPLPELDGGLIVSIKPDSYECFPVNLREAREAAAQLKISWQSKKEGQAAGRKALSKPIILRGEPLGVGDPAVRSWIGGRIAGLSEEAKIALARMWPEDVPTLKASDQHTDVQLEAIAEILASIELDFDAGFPLPDPRKPTPIVETSKPAAALLHPQPSPDELMALEGGEVDPFKIGTIRAVIDMLEPDVRSLVESWAGEAHAAGKDIALAQRHSLWRFSVVSAAIDLATVTTDLEAIRAVLGLALGEEIQSATTVGAALTALTVGSALVVQQICQAISAGSLTINGTTVAGPALSGILAAA